MTTKSKAPADAVTIECPMIVVDESLHRPRRLTIRFNADQREALQQLTHALREQNKELRSGKRVDIHADAVRWLFEKLGEGWEELDRSSHD